MDTVLSIVKWLFIIGAFATIAMDKTSALITRAFSFIICFIAYSNFGTVGLIIAYLIVCFLFIDPNGNDLNKDVYNVIDKCLASKNIIKLNDFPDFYYNKIGRIGRKVKKSERSETAKSNIQEFAREHFEELSSNISKIPVITINTPKGIFYTTQEALDEIRQIAYQLSNLRIIPTKELGDRGVEGEDLAYACVYGIPDFPFTYYTRFIDKLTLPNGHEVDIPYEMINKKVAAEEFTCQKCQGVFQNVFNHDGNRLCSKCLGEIEKAERIGESLIMEVNPDQIPMTDDMADVFAELDSK